ncbi:MAG TPA: glycoside hydrolase domain-containing protein [Verrucomicrobiae bacterium]|nr:glycoside hydrolase domain-containing protein [Candidatus Limnocylindrales bacterium]HXR33824.1 glycoside hydrolase domain-containing protein [Verrucomicrobiae bacterium]
MLSLRLLGPILSLCGLALVSSLIPPNAPTPSPTTFLGFDRNDYPGDDALPALRKTFSFTGYWLGAPPGEKGNSWRGKRALLQSQGFGFAVLFNGRASRTLRNSADACRKGALDAQSAVKLAKEEGFAKGTVIFLDIEEGGRLPAPFHEYLQAWSDGLTKAGYRAGVYCSAMPVDEGGGAKITTAQDIQSHLGYRSMVYWVYNDACPPAPGCAFPANPPPPAQGGFSAAVIWQYAQSPRRKEFTAACAANYARDGNCYAPADTQHRWFLDANVAATPDPSSSH